MNQPDYLRDMLSPQRRGPVLAAALAILALAALYLPVFQHAVDVWSSDEEFSFAYLVPPLALGLVWLRRDQILASPGRGSNLGLIGLIGGLAMLLVDWRIGVHAIGGASFIVTALGLAAFLYGLRTAQVLFFPVVFLGFGLLLYRGLLNSVGFTLQGITATWSAKISTLLGVPVRRDGVDLFVGNFHFVVAEACSGLSSLLALLCLGTLLVALTRTTLLRRVLLIVAIAPIVLVANIIRVTLVLTLSRPFGLAVAQGFLHSMLSVVLFLTALGLFFIVGYLLGCYRDIGVMPS